LVQELIVKLVLFYIHQMNQVNSRNAWHDDGITNIKSSISIVVTPSMSQLNFIILPLSFFYQTCDLSVHRLDTG